MSTKPIRYLPISRISHHVPSNVVWDPPIYDYISMPFPGSSSLFQLHRYILYEKTPGMFLIVAGMASGTWQMLYKSMLLSWLRGWMDGWVEDRWVDEGIEYWFNVFFGLFVVIVFILFFYTASIPTSNIPLRFFVESLLPKRTQSRSTCCPNTKSFPGFSLTLFPSHILQCSIQSVSYSTLPPAHYLHA